MCLCQKKTFAFQKQLDLLNMSGYCCFPGFVILPVRMHLTACLVFCLVMIFLLKPLELKSISTALQGLAKFLTLELIAKAKRKKIDPSHESVQRLHFWTWPKLEVIFFQIKGPSHKINLLCDRKYEQEVEENRKVLALIIGTIVTLGRLGLTIRGHRDDSKVSSKGRRVFNWWVWKLCRASTAQSKRWR